MINRRYSLLHHQMDTDCRHPNQFILYQNFTTRGRSAHQVGRGGGDFLILVTLPSQTSYGVSMIHSTGRVLPRGYEYAIELRPVHRFSSIYRRPRLIIKSAPMATIINNVVTGERLLVPDCSPTGSGSCDQHANRDSNPTPALFYNLGLSVMIDAQISGNPDRNRHDHPNGNTYNLTVAPAVDVFL